MQKIAAALVKAQAAFGPALKSSSNPHFKSRYADLAACVEAVVDALNANGIMLTQRTLECESGVTVETVFVHESGETWGSGPLHVPASKNDAQGYGSALTYARRYSLMAACGIAPEDDDGNAASKSKQPRGDPALVIPATIGAGDDLTAERRSELDNVALDIIDLARDGRETDAIRAYYSIVDNDEKVYVWKRLVSESKLRALIKANSPHKAPAT
jgi:hypothetical protein